MRRVLGLAIVCGAMLAAVGTAGADSPLDSSNGVRHLANLPYAGGTDLAFTGSYAIAGDMNESDGDAAGFRIIDIADPAEPRLTATFACNGAQADVSVWGTLVFLGVDSPMEGPACEAGRVSGDSYWRGVRIVDISDPKEPRLIANVETECGAHTHTVVPDPGNDRVLLYVQSAAAVATISTRGYWNSEDAKCSRRLHNRGSIVEVPLARPAQARVIGYVGVGYASEGNITEPLQLKGCHDVTVYLPRKLAGAACFEESQIWDISNPAAPKILAHIPNVPGRQLSLHHSAGFSWDGMTLVIGDEAGGSSGPACVSGADPLGALWFFDISDPENPVQAGFFSLPRPRGLECTAHNFNVVPVRDRDIMVTGWYTGGLNVVDFTEPSAPREVAYQRFFGPNTGVSGSNSGSDVWSAYWYNGYVYASDRTRGLDVFAIDDSSLAGALRSRYENPQTQEGLSSAPPARTPSPSKSAVLDRRTELPATGVGVPWASGIALIAASAGTVRVLGRSRSYRLNRGP